MDLTLKRSVEDYVKQFGSVELRRDVGCPVFNLNKTYKLYI